MDALRQAVHLYAGSHADAAGIAATPVPGLTTVRATAPSGLVYAISRPLVCLVLQGDKRVTMGNRDVDVSAGDTLLIAADVPTISTITRASLGAPYLSLVLELDPAVIAQLALEIRAVLVADRAPVQAGLTDTEMADTALRLMRLLDLPATLPILQQQLVREMHYWLLAGRHGSAIRNIGWPGSREHRVARAVAALREQFAEPLPVARLAALAGMSPSTFHEHFKAVTSLSPRQFQKQLRLIEARRLLLAGGMSSTRAAYAVGYESVQQFTRDYGRLFGAPPLRDTVLLKATREAFVREPSRA